MTLTGMTPTGMNKNSQPGDASTKPYLLRAIYQWAMDHHLTPQVLVDVGVEGVVVPRGRATDGRIALNIHPQSVVGLEMGDQYLRFAARFGGRPFDVCVPVAAIVAIYGRENGHGIAFQAEHSQPARSPAGGHDSDDRDGRDNHDGDRGGHGNSAKKPKEAAVSHLRLVE